MRSLIRGRRIYRFWSGLALVLTLGLVVVPAASAHVPIGAGNNETLATATLIPDSTKSWAVYADLHQGGQAQYFKFEATRSEKVPIQLYTSPSRRDAGFVPSFVIMGPAVQDRGSVPSYVESPAGAQRMVVKGTRAPQPTYEPFAPGVYLQVAEYSLEAPATGTYYVAVYDEQRGGRYGVAIGKREASTLYEWITNPLAFPSIYAWEGQSLFLAYAPAFLVVAFGLGLLIRRQRLGKRLDLVAWLAAIAGLLFLGSGATVAWQMVRSLTQSAPDALVVVTVFLAALPILVGVLTLRLAMRRSERWTLRSRMQLAALGVVAVLVWAGWVVGPGLAIIAAAVPSAGRASRRPLQSEGSERR